MYCFVASLLAVAIIRDLTEGYRHGPCHRKCASDTLQALSTKPVSHKVSLLCTDQLAGYHGRSKAGYPHATIDHAKREYVVGAVHANTIEGFWSIIKRGVIGAFHKISKSVCHFTLCNFNSATIIASARISSAQRLRDVNFMEASSRVRLRGYPCYRLDISVLKVAD